MQYTINGRMIEIDGKVDPIKETEVDIHMNVCDAINWINAEKVKLNNSVKRLIEARLVLIQEELDKPNTDPQVIERELKNIEAFIPSLGLQVI